MVIKKIKYFNKATVSSMFVNAHTVPHQFSTVYVNLMPGVGHQCLVIFADFSEEFLTKFEGLVIHTWTSNVVDILRSSVTSDT